MAALVGFREAFLNTVTFAFCGIFLGVVGGSDWSPALQGTLGVTFSGLPTRAKFGLEYRYFSAGNVSLTLNPGGSLVLDYDSHNVLVRIRYGF